MSSEEAKKSHWSSSSASKNYQSQRPGYPKHIFEGVLDAAFTGWANDNEAAWSQPVTALSAQRAKGREADPTIFVDVGCGTGQALRELLLSAKFDIIVGVDPSDSQIAEAEATVKDLVAKKLAEENSDGSFEYLKKVAIGFVVGGAEDFEIPPNCTNVLDNEAGKTFIIADKSVDLCTSASALHWFDHRKFAARLHRLLAPDTGRFIAWTGGDSVFTPEGANTLMTATLDKVRKEFGFETHKKTLDPFYPDEIPLLTEPIDGGAGDALVFEGYAPNSIGYKNVPVQRAVLFFKTLSFMVNYYAARAKREATGEPSTEHPAAEAAGWPDVLKDLGEQLAADGFATVDSSMDMPLLVFSVPRTTTSLVPPITKGGSVASPDASRALQRTALFIDLLNNKNLKRLFYGADKVASPLVSNDVIFSRKKDGEDVRGRDAVAAIYRELFEANDNEVSWEIQYSVEPEPSLFVVEAGFPREALSFEEVRETSTLKDEDVMTVKFSCVQQVKGAHVKAGCEYMYIVCKRNDGSIIHIIAC